MALGSTAKERGAALLAVLWLTVALTMIAMTTSFLVRTEAEAVGNHVAAERAALLARGGIEAAIYAIMHPASGDSAATVETGVEQRFQPGQRWLRYEFREGVCAVEVVSENAKLNVNLAPLGQLAALFAALGSAPQQSRELAEAIVDWRTPRASSVATEWDLFYAALEEPYEAHHAAFGEVDELLAVKGMTRDLLFGQLVEDSGGTSRRTRPLADLLTTEQSFGIMNINYAAKEVLQVLPGWNADLASRLVEARRSAPLRTMDDLRFALPEVATLAGVAPVTLSPGPAYTLTATARLNDSKVRRTVRALVRFEPNAPMRHRVVAWWQDWPWSQNNAAAELEPGLAGGSRL